LIDGKKSQWAAWVKDRLELIIDDLLLIIFSVSSALLGVLCGLTSVGRGT